MLFPALIVNNWIMPMAEHMIAYESIKMIVAVYIIIIHECILQYQCKYHLKGTAHSVLF